VLRPIDLHNLEFKQVFRGYDKEQVDEFVSKVVIEYEELYKQKQELEEQIEELKKQASRYNGLEGTLQETLDFVRQSSRELREAAEQTAARIIDDAKREAARILENARREVADEIQQAREALAFRSRVRRQLEMQLLQILDQVRLMPKDDESDEGASSASSISAAVQEEPALETEEAQ